MKCAKCGHKNRATAKFCDDCGAPVRASREAPAAVAAGSSGVAVGGSVAGGVRINSPTIIRSTGVASAPRALLKAYLAAVIKDCRPLRLKGIDQRAARPEAEPLELASVFVDLNTDLRLPTKQSLAAQLKKPADRVAKSQLSADGGRELRRVAVLEALGCHRRLVLLGAPGAGKSTFIQYVTLALAEARLGRKKSLARLGKTWQWGALLPVRVTLRQFAAGWVAAGPEARAKSVWDFIAGEFAQAGLGDKAGEWLRAEVRDKGALFLLDGLDETKEPAVRARVCGAVAEFVRTAGDRCRFLLTSRPYAWEEMEESQRDEFCPPALKKERAAFGALLGEMPVKYRVAEFEPKETARFVERWYRALLAREWIADGSEAAAKTTELQAAVGRDDLRPLARNPLLLTLMATLHSNRTRLPDDRADLYNAVGELLLQRWNENIGADRGLLDALAIPTLKLDDLRGVLEQLAFDVHARQAGRQGEADIPEGDLVAALKPLLADSADKAALAVEYIEQRAGLLLGQGSRGRQRQFTFPHRTFQEFLAGCHLARRRDFEEEVVRLAGENPGHWREVLKLAARHATASRGVPACDVLVCHQDPADWLAAHPATEGDWRKAVLAGEQLLEIGLAAVAGHPRHNVVRERIARWLVALLERGALPARERAEAGNVLARLGDPRKGVVPATLEELSEMEFCYVPPGDFWRGDKEPKQTKLDYGYWIGRHPVTVAQFDLFVKAGGYARKKYWTEARAAKCWRKGKVKSRWDEDWRDRPANFREPFTLSNHPVVNLTWYEAMAYCRWLTEEQGGRLPGGWRIGLPAEAEWEKAARGGEQVPKAAVVARLSEGLGPPAAVPLETNSEPRRVYPWSGEFDAEKVNAAVGWTGASSAAGCFPGGGSPCGAHDLAGNVWEWLRGAHYHEGGRILRGGSFLNVASDARCAVRRWGALGLRNQDFGFRLVVSPYSEL